MMNSCFLKCKLKTAGPFPSLQQWDTLIVQYLWFVYVEVNEELLWFWTVQYNTLCTVLCFVIYSYDPKTYFDVKILNQGELPPTI